MSCWRVRFTKRKKPRVLLHQKLDEIDNVLAGKPPDEGETVAMVRKSFATERKFVRTVGTH